MELKPIAFPPELKNFQNKDVRFASAHAYAIISMHPELLTKTNSFFQHSRLKISESYMPPNTYRPEHLAVLYENAHAVL